MNEDPKASNDERKAKGEASASASVAPVSAGKESRKRKGGEKERLKDERLTNSASAGRRK